MEQTMLGIYRQVVDARVTAVHQVVRLELPILIAVRPEPIPTLSLKSASALPTPARFRPLGPPMFDSPKIAS